MVWSQSESHVICFKVSHMLTFLVLFVKSEVIRFTTWVHTSDNHHDSEVWTQHTAQQWLYTGLGVERVDKKQTHPADKTQKHSQEMERGPLETVQRYRCRKTPRQTSRAGERKCSSNRHGSIKQTSCRPNHNWRGVHTGKWSSEPQARHMYYKHTEITQSVFVSYLLLLSHHRASSWTEASETFPSLPLVLVH